MFLSPVRYPIVLGLALAFHSIVLSADSTTTTDPTEAIIETIEKAVSKKSKDTKTLQFLTRTLTDANGPVKARERAAWALGELHLSAGVPALLEGARHKGLLVRSASLDSLMRFRNKSTLPIFADIAENDPILRLRQRATLALGLLQSDKAISHLVKLSSDKLPEIRGAAALGMAATQSKKNDFSEIMKEMMAESDPYVKIRAEAGWNAIKKKTVVLREQLKSQDSDLRQFAALYFRNQGQSADLNVLKDAWNSEADEDVRFELSAAIESTKKRVAQAKKAAAAKAAAKKNPPAAKTTSQTVN